MLDSLSGFSKSQFRSPRIYISLFSLSIALISEFNTARPRFDIFPYSLTVEVSKFFIIWRALKGGSYSHFPAQILTKSHRPTAQIPSSLCLSCSNLNPIPIFYCFFVDESQSQCMKSHFPSQKMGKSQFPFYPLQDPLYGIVRLQKKGNTVREGKVQSP